MLLDNGDMNRLEQDTFIRLYDEIQKLMEALKDKGLFNNCLNCNHWKDDKCGKFDQLPPPEVIVKGCPEHTHWMPF